MARGRKPDANQYPLPLSGAPIDCDVYRRIESIDYKRTALFRLRWRNAQTLLCKLASLRDGIFAKHETIAEWCHTSVSSVRRTIEDCESLGILVSKPRGHFNVYQIVFDNLWSLENVKHGPPPVVQNEQPECSNQQSDRPKWTIRLANLAMRH